MFSKCSPLVGARRRVSRVLSRRQRETKRRGWPFLWDARRRAPHATHPSGGAEVRLASQNLAMPAAPTRSCSRWGFPCRRRCRRRGALLPHRFTLAARPGIPGRGGGVLSVALSLGSPPPGVTWHRTSVEPGLSSPRDSGSGHPAVWQQRIWEPAPRLSNNREIGIVRQGGFL